MNEVAVSTKTLVTFLGFILLWGVFVTFLVQMTLPLRFPTGARVRSTVMWTFVTLSLAGALWIAMASVRPERFLNLELLLEVAVAMALVGTVAARRLFRAPHLRGPVFAYRVPGFWRMYAITVVCFWLLFFVPVAVALLPPLAGADGNEDSRRLWSLFGGLWIGGAVSVGFLLRTIVRTEEDLGEPLLFLVEDVSPRTGV